MTAQRKVWIALFLALEIIGCARKGTDADLATQGGESPPAMPAPVSQPSTSTTATELKDLPNKLPQQMSQCSSYWDSNTLWSQIKASFFSGSYEPYPTDFDPYSYPYPRGLKTKSSRGLGCMNSLMQLGSMMGGYEDYFESGALQHYLQQMVGWSYRNPFYYGGGATTPMK